MSNLMGYGLTEKSRITKESNSNPVIPDWIWLLAILAVAGGLKLALQVAGVVPFNSDEAVVALMARHILLGDRPIFFYGQAYMGSLDAWLVAAGFQSFGQEVWVIRLVQGLLYAGTIVTAVGIARIVFNDRRVAMLTGLLLAVPPINVTLYTTVSLGGYGEALLLGNVLILIGLHIGRQISLFRLPSWYLWILLGFAAGLGFWAFGLTLIYAVPVIIYLTVMLFSRRHSPIKQHGNWHYWIAPFLLLLFGSLIGSFPWWIYAAEHGLSQLLWELGGGAIAGAERLSWLGQLGQHLFNFILLGGTVTLGLRPPWDVRWLGMPLAPFALATWFAAILWIVKVCRRKEERTPEKLILVGVILVLSFAFVISPFGADPSGRYFLPLVVPLALFAADLIARLVAQFGKFAWGLAAIILIYNFWGTLDSTLQFPPGVTTQYDRVAQIDHSRINDLMMFLRQEGEERGYTSYWIAYPLAFLSQEELIFIPLLPTHEDFRYSLRDDRYPPYDALVAISQRPAYITANVPDLDSYLRSQFANLNVHWKEIQIGDYQVFYDLSDRVEPNEIGLGFTTFEQ